MTKSVKSATSAPTAPSPVSAGAVWSPAEAESLHQLRGDCAQMAPHWKAVRQDGPAPGSASDLHGVEVPATSAALVDGMPQYGD